MILTIDIGNSNITLALYKDGTLCFTERVVSDRDKRDTFFVEALLDMCKKHTIDIHEIDDTVLCSVVPILTEAMCKAVSALTGREPVIINSYSNLGMSVRMDHPDRVGADLLAGAAYAAHKYPLPLAVVDMGSANTIACVNSRREYIGTIIMPGLKMSAQSLSGAAQLFTVEPDTPSMLLGTNTKASIESGLIYGTAAMMDGLLDRIEEEHGPLATVVITGGTSSFVAPYMKHTFVYEENLLSDSLFYLGSINDQDQMAI